MSLQGRLLLVEDDFAVRETLAMILEDEGYEVDCAADGVEAWARLEANPLKPALIILDLWMPHMDGLEFRAMQLGLSRFADIPVMVITASGTNPAQTDAMGLDDILRKPLDIDRVLATVARLVAGPPSGMLN